MQDSTRILKDLDPYKVYSLDKISPYVFEECAGTFDGPPEDFQKGFRRGITYRGVKKSKGCSYF